MILKRIRARRAERKKLQKTIFRRGGTSSDIHPRTSPLIIQPAMTYTLSQDEEQTSVASSIITQQQSCLKESELSEMKLVMAELKELHAEAMAGKDEEIACLQDSLYEAEQKLVWKHIELGEVKKQLITTKETLVIVSRHLMQHQHELHETREQLDSLTNLANIGRGIAGMFAF